MSASRAPGGGGRGGPGPRGPAGDAEGQMVPSQQVITASHPEEAAEVPAPAQLR